QQSPHRRDLLQRSCARTAPGRDARPAPDRARAFDERNVGLMAGWLTSGRSRLATFTGHEPPVVAPPRLDRAEDVVFVRDGFSWAAALFAPFFLAIRGEWLGLAVYAVAVTVLSLVLDAIGAAPDWMMWVVLLLGVITGFEANELQRWSLARRGWH